MRWYVSAIILSALAVGVYFHVVTFDPVSFVMLAVVLLNNHNLMQRQEQTAELIKKSHDVTVANQKLVLDSIKRINADLRKL